MIASRSERASRTGLVLAVASLCQLMVVLDVSVVNLALPSIRADLGFHADGLEWVINAYTLPFGALLLLGGRIADLFGHRRCALAGLGLFGITSLLGGLATTPGELVAARALQGVAAAVLLPISLTLVQVTFPEGQARQRALAIWAAVGSVGGALGLILGGALVQELDWRWVMFINVPIAIGTMLPAFRAIPERVAGQRPRMDVPGAVLVTAGLFSLVYGVVGTDKHSWGSAHTLAALALAAALLGAFVVIERHVASAPLVRLGLLRNRQLLGANVVMLIVGSTQFGAFYLASLYLQGTLGYGPLHTGLAFVPFSFGVIAGSIAARRLVAQVGARGTLVGGLVVGAAGFAWFTGLGPHGSFAAQVLGPLLLTSLGIGLCIVSLATAATSGVVAHEAGLASGLLNASRQAGGSIGLAVLVTVANAAGNRTVGTDRAFLVATVLMLAGTAIAAALMGAPRYGADATSASVSAARSQS